MYEYKYLILDASSSQFYFVKCNNKEQLSINKIGSVSHRFTSQGHTHRETTLKVIYIHRQLSSAYHTETTLKVIYTEDKSQSHISYRDNCQCHISHIHNSQGHIPTETTIKLIYTEKQHSRSFKLIDNSQGHIQYTQRRLSRS